ncbi:conserved hypothetical protein [Zunongwangia profunda SM-A87]|uniref:Metal-sensitive transcriptional regulator n=2 Tax=Zunongwangia profunda TaxID=398743 RepID=D5BJ56_ZUNPS|nr:conserved hypothetical protein [Zunongwangia profunda SM-A87]
MNVIIANKYLNQKKEIAAYSVLTVLWPAHQFKKIKDVIIQVVAKHYNGQIMKGEQYKLPTDLILDIKSRLKTLSGQINGIVKMLDEGKDPEQINIQFRSIDKGIQKAHYLLLDEVYRKALAIGIVKAVDSCPGNCGNEDKIEYLKSEFPNLELSDLTNRLKEIQTIETRLKNYNEKKVKKSLVTPYLTFSSLFHY